MTPILLLNYVKDFPAIMVATHANYTLQLIVMSIQRALIELIVDLLRPQGAYMLGKKIAGSVSLEQSTIKMVEMMYS